MKDENKYNDDANNDDGEDDNDDDNNDDDEGDGDTCMQEKSSSTPRQCLLWRWRGASFLNFGAIYLATSTCSRLQETPCLSVSCFVDCVDSVGGGGRVVLDKVVDLGGQMLIVDVSSRKRMLARQ